MVQKQELPSQFHEELQRVLGSETFRHSESMRRLLEYLGEKSLTGATDGLKEYTIGLEAFNKPDTYDPQLDSTIRVLVNKLRRRLDEYYGKEGANNPVRMDIPKGHFELRFHLCAEQNASSPERVLGAQARRWRRISIGLGACVVLLVLLGVYWRWISIEANPGSVSLESAWTPELELIWQPFLESNHSLVVSLGTPMMVKLSGLFFRNSRINDWQEAQGSEQVQLLQKALQAEYAVPSFPYTGVGEASGAFLLAKLLTARKPSMVLKRAHTLSWEDVRTSNVIFLGPPKFNRLLKEMPAEEGLVIERGAIRNPHPRPGEKDTYSGDWSDDHMELVEDYALIHRLPGLHDHGEIMMLGSASTEATWAAVQYVTMPVYARELVAKLRLPSGQLPRQYQVVIHVQFRDQVPWKISYVTHRVLNGSLP